MNRLLRSTAFRLVLMYMAIFGVSVAALLFFVYDSMVEEMENQVMQTVNIELADLGRKFILDGPASTVATIEHLIKQDKGNNYVYLLLNRRWKVMAGNLERWPGGSPSTREWITFPFEKARRGDYVPNAIAINSSLPGGHILLVGHSLSTLERMQQTFSRMILTSIGLTLLLGAAGGALLTWRINKRLETINDVCHQVITGDLQQRVTVSGGGDEFDHLAENFNAMLFRINELVDGIRDISSSVAHDLRTPLTKLRNRLEQIEREMRFNPAIAHKEIHQALEDIDGVVSTFNSILRIAQVEGGAGIEQFTTFDLSQAVLDVADFYVAVAEDRGLQLAWDIEEKISYHGDRHLIAQALANIVDNAIKYTPVGGNIRMSCHAKPGHVAITISDSGPGIPEDHHDKVVQKFYRLESSRTSPGSGLGLSLAAAAFKLHSGQMTFSDNQPGLIVRITLPIL